MSINTRWIVAVSFALAAAGFLLPLWPISAVGIVLAAASGRYIAAIGIGLLLDVAYGAPIGHFHFLYVPFTLLAVVIALLRWYLSSFLRESTVESL
jgi:hypothetical protein